MMSAIVALEDNIKESNRNRAKREIPILISKSNIIDKLKKRVMHYEFFNKNISKHLKRGYNKVWDSNLT
jgi:hypothetical protein